MVTYFVKRGRIPLLSLNELGEKSPATIIFVKFVNKPKSNSDWLIVFGNFFLLVKIESTFTRQNLFLNF